MEKQNSSIFSFSIFLLKITTLVAIMGLVFNYAFENLIIFKSHVNGASKINRIITKTAKNEIPIFGSSRAEGSYIPSIINKEHAFNYGIEGGQANIWLFFLEQELKKEKETAIIINYDLGGLRRSDGNISNYIPNWNATKSIVSSKKSKPYYNIPFIKYYGQYERYFKSYLSEKTNLTKFTDHGGSFEKNIITEAKFQELSELRAKTKDTFMLEEDLLLKFNTLVNSTSRKIILVVAPMHKSCYTAFENIDDFDNYLNKVNTKQNIEVIDLRDYLSEDAMFYNTTHLNYEGAEKFSQKLKEQIAIRLKS